GGALAGSRAWPAIVFAFAHRALAHLASAAGTDTTPRLLLTGVMLAAGWTALITLMLALAPEAQIRGMLFWLAGDLAGADAVALPLLTLAAAVLLTAPLARELNVL